VCFLNLKNSRRILVFYVKIINLALFFLAFHWFFFTFLFYFFFLGFCHFLVMEEKTTKIANGGGGDGV